MALVHIFFESLEDWVGATHRQHVYGLPFIQTVPSSQGMAWKESRIILSQIYTESVIYHCLSLVARRLDPMDREKKQEQSARLDLAWETLQCYLIEQGFETLHKGFIGYDANLKTLDVYLPKFLTDRMEAQDVSDAPANPN